ncbi:EVE domain-containing protein [Wenzhouxiangella marina]|uniref:EVE domain-containing protein n=1 Tax=Wenzhouxiangella marina TaxID=1579979 RepID=A0A0K0XUN5_9GAMM|nr:EVE domain-containing protein [Wenzhouxiangella marina]AKS41424.1 EVE domain-containing protein [Wenzhouxiangella marina]MBB6086822.1 putative RNA-binding protein with PUA-like domain [Wenzhouxiangella marina]
MNYWLMKSEPDAFSIDDLKNRPDRTEPWDGVRNYQARNFMRDEMKVGDRIFFYHSNCKVPGIVGIATVASEPYPDRWQFDPDSKYYDPKSDPDNPRWILVDVKYERHLDRVLSLNEIKEHAEALGDFALTRRGNRLSIMPVDDAQWDYLLGLEKQ